MGNEARQAETSASPGHYCARCLALTTAGPDACPRCATPFTGAGRFDRIQGPRPSGEFAFLFAAAEAS